MITRFEQDMDGSMCPEDGGQWVRFDDLVAENAALAGTKLYPRPDPRVSELEARLEIDEHGWDGISCRDETIKWQDIKIAELEAKLQQMNSLCEFNERTMSDVASKYEALEAQIAALLVAIEAKDAALNLWKVASGNAEESELDDMACYCITMPLFCDAYDATEALALSPSTELLEARDRVRDAKLLRAVDRYLLDIGDSCSDDPLNELAKARESGEWQLGLGD